MNPDHHEKIESLRILLARRCSDIELIEAEHILDELKITPPAQPASVGAPSCPYPDREVWLQSLVALAGQSGERNESCARAFADSIRKNVSEIVTGLQHDVTLLRKQLASVVHQCGGLITVDFESANAPEVQRGIVNAEVVDGCVTFSVPIMGGDE